MVEYIIIYITILYYNIVMYILSLIIIVLCNRIMVIIFYLPCCLHLRLYI